MKSRRRVEWILGFARIVGTFVIVAFVGGYCHLLQNYAKIIK